MDDEGWNDARDEYLGLDQYGDNDDHMLNAWPKIEACAKRGVKEAQWLVCTIGPLPHSKSQVVQTITNALPNLTLEEESWALVYLSVCDHNVDQMDRAAQLGNVFAFSFCDDRTLAATAASLGDRRALYDCGQDAYYEAKFEEAEKMFGNGKVSPKKRQIIENSVRMTLSAGSADGDEDK